MRQRDSENGKRSGKSHAVEIGGHIGNINLLDNGAPPYELRIDKDGKWFHEGIEIVRDDIRNLFMQNLVLYEDGSYWVKMGHDECPVTVEDVPFMVLRVTKAESDGKIMLLLNDGRTQPLMTDTLSFKDSNVPYCRVRGRLEARFSRAAYYQLAEFIEYDETNNKYLLACDAATIELEVPKNE